MNPSVIRQGPAVDSGERPAWPGPKAPSLPITGGRPAVMARPERRQVRARRRQRCARGAIEDQAGMRAIGAAVARLAEDPYGRKHSIAAAITDYESVITGWCTSLTMT